MVLEKVNRNFLNELVGYIFYFEERLIDLEERKVLSESQSKCYWNYHFILTNYICFYEGDNFPDCSLVNDEKYFKPHPSKMVERLMDEFDKSEEQCKLWKELLEKKEDEFDKKVQEYEKTPKEKRDPDENPWLDDTTILLIKKYEEELSSWRAYDYELLCLHSVIEIIFSDDVLVYKKNKNE